MQNKLFDSIIRSSGVDTDDIHSGEVEDNFLADNQLFEAILSEISTYRFFGIFSLKNLRKKSINVYHNFSEAYRKYESEQRWWQTHEVLPCNKEGSLQFYTEEQLNSVRADMVGNLIEFYRDKNNSFTGLLGKFTTYITQNCNLDYKQGKLEPVLKRV